MTISPLPWHCQMHSGCTTIYDAIGHIVCVVPDSSNAIHIVDLVNASAEERQIEYDSIKTPQTHDRTIHSSEQPNAS